MRSLTLLSTLIGLSTAHFELKYPKSIGFRDADQDQGPCGGFTPDLSKDLVEFHVGGEAIALRSTHPQGNWLFRVTLDEKAESGWEQIFPIVQQSGLGDFCEPQVTLSEDFVGKKGVVSVVSSAVDGLLYQCIAATFVSGTGETPSECKNASSVRASFVDDSALSALVDGSDSDSNDTDSSATSATSAAPSATETPNVAASMQVWATMGLGSVVAFLSCALMI